MSKDEAVNEIHEHRLHYDSSIRHGANNSFLV